MFMAKNFHTFRSDFAFRSLSRYAIFKDFSKLMQICIYIYIYIYVYMGVKDKNKTMTFTNK